jgi:hypothetical protein
LKHCVCRCYDKSKKSNKKKNKFPPPPPPPPRGGFKNEPPPNLPPPPSFRRGNGLRGRVYWGGDRNQLVFPPPDNFQLNTMKEDKTDFSTKDCPFHKMKENMDTFSPEDCPFYKWKKSEEQAFPPYHEGHYHRWEKKKRKRFSTS